jgi:hypothetical protein
MPRKLIIIGAMCVLLVTAFIGGIVFLVLKTWKNAAAPTQSTPKPAATARTSTPNKPFANLPESAIPGRYQIIGNEVYFLTLHEDHTLYKDGKARPKYHWYLTPEALVIDWGPNQHRYDKIEGPGRFSCPKSIGGRRFMEKQPADPSDLVKPDSPPSGIAP